MNGPLIDAAKRILKRRYGVVCTEPFAGVDRFRRTTGNLVAQVSLESVKGGPVYKVSLYGFYYNSDETYDEELQIKATETMNPIDMAELIDEWLSRVETNLSIKDEQHRQYSKKKRILSLGEAIDILAAEPVILETTGPRTAEEWKRISEIWLNKRDEQVKLLQDHPLWIGTPAELKTKKLIAKYDGYYKKAVEEWKKCVD